jgi:hypothetical protein
VCTAQTSAYGVYGIEKVWRQLKREGHKVGRDRVARLMDDLELSGVVAASANAQPTRQMSVNDRPTLSSVSSPHPHRTSCGSPI